MATSSIFANFTIHDSKKAEQFADALSKSARLLSKQGNSRKSLSVVELNGKEEIKAFLKSDSK